MDSTKSIDLSDSDVLTSSKYYSYLYIKLIIFTIIEVESLAPSAS